MPLFRKQSAAEQTSLAPHDSKARLRVVTTCRRFMAKPCTPHPTTRKGYATSVRQQSCQRLCNAQRVQFFELLSCNGGVKGQSPLRSLGGPRGPFSHVREWPPYLRTLRHAGNKVQSTALPKIFCLSAKKKERLGRGVLLIFAKVKFTDTSACRRWQGRGRRRRRW